MNQPAGEPAPEATPETPAPEGTLMNAETPPAPEGTPEAQLPKHPEFRDMLSEAYRDDPTISRFKTADDLSKSYLEARSKLGQSVNMPTDTSTDEEKLAFKTKLGWSEDVNKYIPEVAEGADPRVAEWFGKTMQAKGVPVNEAAGIWEAWVGLSTELEQDADNQAARDALANKESLQQLWGKDFATKMAVGENVLNKMFSENTREAIIRLKLNSDPNFVTDLVNLGNSLKEDASGGPASLGKGLAVSVDAIRAEINTLRDGPDYYTDHVQNQVKAMYKEIEALEKRLNS